MTARWTVFTAAAGGLGVALTAASAFAQHLGQAAETPDVPVWRVLAAFLLCAGLAVGGAFALRSRLRGNAPPLALFSRSPRRLGIVESLRLSHQVDVCLYRCDDREFMVVTSAGGTTVVSVRDALGRRTSGAEPATEPPAPGRARKRGGVLAKSPPSPELQ